MASNNTLTTADENASITITQSDNAPILVRDVKANAGEETQNTASEDQATTNEDNQAPLEAEAPIDEASEEAVDPPIQERTDMNQECDGEKLERRVNTPEAPFLVKGSASKLPP